MKGIFLISTKAKPILLNSSFTLFKKTGMNIRSGISKHKCHAINNNKKLFINSLWEKLKLANSSFDNVNVICTDIKHSTITSKTTSGKKNN